MTISDDFSIGQPNPGLWNQITGATVNNQLSQQGRLQSLFFGGLNNRQATTVNLDTTEYKALQFDLIYGDDANGGEFLDPGSEVVLDYSTNGGRSWTPIQTYTFPGRWTQFRVNLPIAAQTAETQLRWRQPRFDNSIDANVWAIDNLALATTPHIPPTTADFSTGPNAGLWKDMAGAVVNSTFAGRSQSLFFGGLNNRQATTVNLDTTKYKALQFDLIYGNGSNGGEFLDPGSEVVLEYSTNGGGSWTNLQKFTFPGSWTQFRVNLPSAVQNSTETQLRWRQPRFDNSLDANVWAIENLALSTTPHIPPTTADFSTGPNAGLWKDMAGAVVNSTFAGRSQSLFFGGLNNRQATTVNLDTTKYKALQFDLIYGNGSNGGEFLDPGSEVVLEYSTNGGGSWTNLQKFTFPGSWTQFRVNLPSAVRNSTETQLRWRQPRFDNSLDANVWAIDNLALATTPHIPPTTADFSTGPNAGLWKDMAGAVVNSTFAGRSQSLFFGGLNNRQATTVNLDTTKYKALQFDLIYGNGSNGGEFLDPGSEVVLEYSTNGGGSWAELQKFTFPGKWTQFRVNLPSAVQNSTETQLRWRQPRFDNSLDANVWAIDNIKLLAPQLPVVSGITVEGNELLVQFSKPIVSIGDPTSRFTAKVGTSDRTITAIQAGADASRLRLSLSGPAPTSSQTVRLSYTDDVGDQTTGVIQDKAGNDLDSIVSPGQAADTFSSSVSVTALATTTSNLVLTGSNAINGTGNNLANTITGNGAANSLNGGGAADRLIGKGGNDRLTGALGADIFRFDAALSSSNNRDTITDFNPSQGDRIELENGVFNGLTKTGPLAPTAFRSGRSFNSAAQRILYNPSTGNLTYDSNGNAAGGVSALIAVLTNKPALTHSMFIVT